MVLCDASSMYSVYETSPSCLELLCLGEEWRVGGRRRGVYWATAKATTDESEWDRETLMVLPLAASAASPESLTWNSRSAVIQCEC